MRCIALGLSCARGAAARTTAPQIIRIDDISGRNVVQFGSFGNGVGQFNQTAGIAFGARGRIYIADEYNHRLVRIDDMTGVGWTTYGSYGGGVGQFSQSTVTGEAAWGPVPGMDHFTIYVDNTNGARTAYSLTHPRADNAELQTSVGTEPGWTTLTMTLRNKTGVIVQTLTRPMGPGVQLTEDVSARFPAAGSGFEGTVEITPVARNKVQATAVRYDNGDSQVITAPPVFTHVSRCALPRSPPACRDARAGRA